MEPSTSSIAAQQAMRVALLGALGRCHDAIDAAFVFGSLARGAAAPGSDVDVFIVGDIDFREVVRLFYPVEGTLGRDVNPVVLTARAWRTRVSERDPFLSDVLTRPKLFLIGSEHVLAELGGDQSRRGGPGSEAHQATSGCGQAKSR
ncbi:DNA polymerase subunit beta [Cupriavidus gilardii CR3]|uniref:Nucleotidyltransferase domain-containing protein n=3 Tax=Cupriavidus gilardii TaxID=82541 RepID=A0A849B9K5_9BURK|nr:nucleotidyltransferase domain-containing protein [Cupriavidus gilardii]ALD93524.1 DNA polymerase subunit beta [Cupriavidus gilardii CR3]MCT9013440.1 nucleotidyltransferase domain-containing protein [Cupriavidus gilardii]MCT9016477.1 nucleotidyltransferase domain-containing protein [Cupriavidus gilardii]MCT9056247.1 nucleotidyltransferase domain-containing protein [Cupriavidus gilardii]NNH11096.1 nucleotidyltransferase domain-containing protein [Cupriavidus gilardii]